MRFLLDAGVPDLVAGPLRAARHEVVLHRELLSDGAPDDLVCRTAIIEAAVLVAIDRDMRRMAKPYGSPTGSGLFETLHLVSLVCAEWQAAARVGHALSFIEHEWHVSENKRARRLWVDIGPHFLRTHR